MSWDGEVATKFGEPYVYMIYLEGNYIYLSKTIWLEPMQVGSRHALPDP
jgi:hypothetical protein